MFVLELLVALILALVISAILGAVFGWGKAPRTEAFPPFIFVFLILFFAIWAGGVWLVPFGPVLWNIHWLPFIWVGIIVALLVGALLPPRRSPVTEAEMTEKADVKAETTFALGIFFWLFFIMAIGALIFHYSGWMAELDYPYP